MKALLQRVTRASVDVGGERVAEIGPGLVVLLGIEQGDAEEQGCALLDRVINYRVFADARDRMNLSLRDTAGSLLLVPQFTLAADTRKGRRPSFSGAAAPELGARLFEAACDHARHQLGAGRVETGIFGADMQVGLVNNGPVTFWLEVTPSRAH